MEELEMTLMEGEEAMDKHIAAFERELTTVRTGRASGNILDNVKESGAVLAEILDGFVKKHPCVGDARHIGLFSCVELVKDKATKEPIVPYGKDPEGIMGKVIGLLKERKFMTYSHENMVFICPPLIITKEQVKEELAKMDEVLSIVDRDFI